MSQAKELVKRYFAEVWDPANPGDPEALRRILSPSFKRHVSPVVPPLDREGQIERLAGIVAALPDINFRLEELVGEGDFAAARATLRGTHLGDFAGIPGTGKEVTVSVIDVFRAEGDQFAEQWGGPDVWDMVRQLGFKVTADQ
ncbi:MAG: ester cyclase [Acidimicrobiia bacterium]